MYDEEELTEEDIRRLQEMGAKYQTEEAHGGGMEVNVTRDSTNEVSPTMTDGEETGLDLSFNKQKVKRKPGELSFPTAEEAEEAFMSEEEKLQNKIAELEDEAAQRKNRIQQKQKLRELKSDVRKAKVREAVAPATEKLEPVLTGGKKTADLLGKAGKKGADILSAMGSRGRKNFGEPGKGMDSGSMGFGGEPSEPAGETPPGQSEGIGRLGSSLDMGSKSNLGTTGRKQASVSLSENKKEDIFGQKKESGISGVLQNKNSAIGFSGKKGSMFDMGGQRERLVDWGAKKDRGIGFGKKESLLSFDAKPGNKFSFGNEEKPRRKPKKNRKKTKKKSRKKKDSLDINLIIGRK